MNDEWPLFDPNGPCGACGHTYREHAHNETAPSVCRTCKSGPAPASYDAWHEFEVVRRTSPYG